MVTTDRHPGGRLERWQRGDKAEYMERREPGTPPQQHAKTEKGRGAEPGKPCGAPARSLWKPGGKALDRRGRKGRAGQKTPAGKGDPQKRVRERGREGKGRDGRKTTAARHSMERRAEGRGRAGGGEQPQTPAGPAVSK